MKKLSRKVTNSVIAEVLYAMSDALENNTAGRVEGGTDYQLARLALAEAITAAMVQERVNCVASLGVMGFYGKVK